MNKIPNQTNKNSDAKILILIFFCIFVLIFVSYWRMRDFQQALPEIEIPEFETPEIMLPEFDLDKLEDLDKLKDLKNLGMEDFIMPEHPEENYKTFISPNEALKIKYPANWQAIDKIFLEKASQKMKEYKLKESELLFLAYQKRLVEHPPLLIIQSLPLEKILEEIIEEVKKIAEKKQIEITIIETGVKDEKNYFKIRYKKENYLFYLKGIFIPSKERNYLITILALGQFREEIAQQVNFIFDSIQIVQ